ncbi:MAG: hypothetical protein KUA43_00480 [Hoeflea sp.]|uniref:hypothetical protein n=1 Tax=Hoeflea sp. TaxID=1940281 RepID=UPI001DD16E8B|nr:hypothetical protein [Hoeflea sp.]MBU4530311.1 hypothetical protein [Alphaproteobacteria bacterium]MBU4545098.1 hypothetical protein [Alphaproteobacteria bacterium]MBU4549702.1 hypothetical protein [Alphaproteobacteria bacterium]MBV1721901.1 hypothetical protein [Hoeflea sp.]MBV1761251.1 hypothetical protein [Hoeflea sp.]
MAGHLQHLKLRNGHFLAVVVVSRALRPDPDATAEPETQLGGDRREALRMRAALDAIAETSVAKVTSFPRDGVALHPVRLKA